MAEYLDRNIATPLYVQLEKILRDNIANGVWQPNQRIPSENELDKMYGLSRMTVRSVLSQLVRDGLLYRVQGKGTFVAQPKISTQSPAYLGIREQLETMGYQTTTKLLRMERIPAPPNIQKHLQLEPDEDVFLMERVRNVQGDPVSIHTSYVPYRLAPTLDGYNTESDQLCVILDQHFGLQMGSVSESLESVSATTTEAQLLHIKRGDPLLRLEDIIMDRDGRRYEYSNILFRGNRMKLHFEYQK